MNYENVALQKIINKYNFEDVVIAIFTINSWRNNSSLVISHLMLNNALKKYIDSEPTKGILDYSQFKKFFENISGNLEANKIYSDPVLTDFGEIKLDYQGDNYSVIIGDGYQYSYPFLKFLSFFASHKDSENVFMSGLKYLNFVISNLSEKNVVKDKYSFGIFELPSEEYYLLVRKFFENFDIEQYLNVVKFLKADNIENAHFIEKNDKIFPLFNSSFMVDIGAKIIKAQDHNILIQALTGFTNYWANHITSERDGSLFIQPVILEGENLILELKCSCAYFNYEGEALLIYNSEKITTKEITEEIQEIEKYNEKGLELGDIIQKKRTKLKPKYAFNIIVHDNNVDITQESIFESSGEYTFTTAIDFINLLLMINNFDDLIKFLKHISLNNDKFQNLFTGLSGEYSMLEDMNYVVSEGAVEFDLINIGLESTIDKIYSKFLLAKENMPLKLKTSLNNIFLWKMKEDESDWLTIERKNAASPLGGIIKKIENTYIYIEYDADYIQEIIDHKMGLNFLNILDDILTENINKHFPLLLKNKSLSDKIIKCVFVSSNIFEQRFSYILNGEIGNSILLTDSENDELNIYYTLDIDLFLENAKNSETRREENTFIKMLFSPLKPSVTKEEWNAFENAINLTNKMKKIASIIETAMPYFYEEDHSNINISIETLKKIRKRIAKVCKSKNIKPGIYKNKKARDIIRSIQEVVYSDFESEIYKYKSSDIRRKLLELLSTKLHHYNITKMRYEKMYDRVEEEQAERNYEKNKKIEQDLFEKIKNLKTIIEINETKQKEGGNILSEENIQFLMAYAQWYNTLQDNADIAHWELELSEVEVTDMYVVNINDIEEINLKQEELYFKRKKYGYYKLRDREIDKKYIAEFEKAFKKDMDFDFRDLLDVLTYFSQIFFENENIKEGKNVFSVKKDAIAKYILASADPEYTLNVNNIEKAINYLCIMPSKLKTLNGKEHPIIPVWDREKRSNRIDQRPLIQEKENILFSPVLIGLLKEEWTNGMFSFFLPHIDGLDETQKVIKEWKHQYEDKIVEDLVTVFEKKLSDKIVMKEIELDKILYGKRGANSIGDTDVFVIDNENKCIWFLEVKYLQNHGSVYELYRQQNLFFNEEQYEKKFKKRIDFFVENRSDIFLKFGIDDLKYDLKPMFVLNKPFLPLYSEEPEIKYISFNELKYNIENKIYK